MVVELDRNILPVSVLHRHRPAGVRLSMRSVPVAGTASAAAVDRMTSGNLQNRPPQAEVVAVEGGQDFRAAEVEAAGIAVMEGAGVTETTNRLETGMIRQPTNWTSAVGY